MSELLAFTRTLPSVEKRKTRSTNSKPRELSTEDKLYIFGTRHFNLANFGDFVLFYARQLVNCYVSDQFCRSVHFIGEDLEIFETTFGLLSLLLNFWRAWVRKFSLFGSPYQIWCDEPWTCLIHTRHWPDSLTTYDHAAPAWPMKQNFSALLTTLRSELSFGRSNYCSTACTLSVLPFSRPSTVRNTTAFFKL